MPPDEPAFAFDSNEAAVVSDTGVSAALILPRAPPYGAIITDLTPDILVVASTTIAPIVA